MVSRMKLLLVLALVFIMAVSVFTGCGKDNGKIVLASKPVTEQYVLAEILTILIEQESDLKVEQQLGIGGGTSNIHPALIKGDIDLYPEYTGTGWLFVLKESLVRDPVELYGAVKEAYEAEYDVHWSGLYGFNNTYGIAVTKEAAEAYNLKTISDLGRASSELVFAANPDFLEREDGFVGLTDEYGLDFKSIKEIDIGLRYDAINSGEVDVITVFSTDARLLEQDAIILEDDKLFFASYYAATLVRNDTLKKYPELEGVLELLTDKISNEEMIAMNYRVEIENADPADVARDFLAEKGLLK